MKGEREGDEIGTRARGGRDAKRRMRGMRGGNRERDSKGRKMNREEAWHVNEKRWREKKREEDEEKSE